MISLEDYLFDSIKKQWSPGRMDCCCFVAGYALLVTGLDPMGDLRGRYDDNKSAKRLVMREGGLLNSLNKRLCSVGYHKSVIPDDGDIGIVDIGENTIAGQAAVIRFGPRWAGRTEKGLFMFEMDALAVWSFHV